MQPLRHERALLHDRVLLVAGNEADIVNGNPKVRTETLIEPVVLCRQLLRFVVAQEENPEVFGAASDMENVGRADSRTRAFGLPQRRQKISRRLGRHAKRQVRLHRVFKLRERQRLRRPPGKKRFRQAAAGRKFQGLCLFVQQKDRAARGIREVH